MQHESRNWSEDRWNEVLSDPDFDHNSFSSIRNAYSPRYTTSLHTMGFGGSSSFSRDASAYTVKMRIYFPDANSMETPEEWLWPPKPLQNDKERAFQIELSFHLAWVSLGPSYQLHQVDRRLVHPQVQDYLRVNAGTKSSLMSDAVSKSPSDLSPLAETISPIPSQVGASRVARHYSSSSMFISKTWSPSQFGSGLLPKQFAFLVVASLK